MVEVMKTRYFMPSEQDVLTATLAKLLEQEARTARGKGGPADCNNIALADWPWPGSRRRSKLWPTDRSMNC